MVYFAYIICKSRFKPFRYALSCIVFYSNRLYYPAFVLTLMLALMPHQSAIAQSPVLDKKINFSCSDCSVSKALLYLKDSAQLTSISFNDKFLKKLPDVTITEKEKTVEELIRMITNGVEVKIDEEGGSIYLTINEHTFILHGEIRDKDTGESIPEASVAYINHDGRRVRLQANEYGRYYVREVPGTYLFEFVYPGYQKEPLRIKLEKNREENVALRYRNQLDIVEVEEKINQPESGPAKRSANGATDLVGYRHKTVLSYVPGEDIAGIISQTSGVSTGVDGLGGLNIRGGNADQNLFLLDDVPVYNPGHALGLVSVFNNCIVKSSNLWKGDFSARYGGRAAAVVDVRTRDGNFYKFSGGVFASLTSSSVVIEGPLKKEKSSFLVSYRRSYFDPLIKIASSKTRSNVLNADFRNLAYHFSDINVKMNWKKGKKNHFYASFYTGGDEFEAPLTQRTDAGSAGIYLDTINFTSKWGNTIASVRWNRLHNDAMFSNTTFSYSTFKYKSELALSSYNIAADGKPTQLENNIQIYNSDIRDFAVRHDFSYLPARNFSLRLGASSILHQVNPGAISVNFLIPGQTADFVDSLENSITRQNRLYPLETEMYGTAEVIFLKDFQANIGLNNSLFIVKQKKYWALQPRTRLQYNPSKTGISSWVSYNFMSQYMHQIGSYNIGLPFELWVPTTDKVKPERVRQFSTGISWGDSSWGVCLEAYSKNMSRVLVLRSVSESILGGSADDSRGWEERIIEGKGRSKGLELEAEKKSGRITGLISYTLSKTDRQFGELNEGKVFPFKFDRRHILNGNFTFKVIKRLDFSVKCNYESGNPITLAVVKYNYESVDPSNPVKPKEIYAYTKINGYRLPPIKRLDLSVTYRWNAKFANSLFNHRIQLGVYNVTNRKNPFYQVININSSKTKNGVQYTLLPRMPLVNYEMTF